MLGLRRNPNPNRHGQKLCGAFSKSRWSNAMMNDPKLAIERLNDIVRESSRDKNLPERAALYSAARFLLADIREHFTSEEGRIDSYMSEKIHKSLWHIAAALGFDIDNDHDDEQHRVWAYGSLNTLSNIIDERIAREDEADG